GVDRLNNIGRKGRSKFVLCALELRNILLFGNLQRGKREEERGKVEQEDNGKLKQWGDLHAIVIISVQLLIIATQCRVSFLSLLMTSIHFSRVSRRAARFADENRI
ncbi:hypothetical protein, partial [Corallococcus sp. CA041A]|uniref:hypothetical protein n=1 Tax=Corallococcus sp. CA041A TaxID=2316727 RepID=UPI001F2D00C0